MYNIAPTISLTNNTIDLINNNNDKKFNYLYIIIIIIALILIVIILIVINKRCKKQIKINPSIDEIINPVYNNLNPNQIRNISTEYNRLNRDQINNYEKIEEQNILMINNTYQNSNTLEYDENQTVLVNIPNSVNNLYDFPNIN